MTTNNVLAFKPLIAQPSFCSGFGKFHTNHPDKTIRNPYLTITYDEIVNLAYTPPDKHKGEGQWVIPSRLKDELAREHAYQRENGFYGLLWADIDKGNPTLKQIQKVLHALHCGYLIYSTKSATSANRKWRVIIPLADLITGQSFPYYQRMLNQLFVDANIQIDSTNEANGQLCYLPNKGEYYECYQMDLLAEFNVKTWTKQVTSLKDAALAKLKKPLIEGIYGNSMVDDNQAEREKIQKALNTLDPDMNEPKWRKVGLAIHNTGWSDAYELWREWSAKGKKYDEQVCLTKWGKMKPDGGIILDYLYSEAFQVDHKWDIDISFEPVESGGATVQDVPKNVMVLHGHHCSITESAKTIFPVIAKKRDMFIMGDEIVEVKKLAGTMSVVPVSYQSFRSRIEKYSQKIMGFIKTQNNQVVLVNKICSADNAKVLMASHVAEEVLPPINMVTECPILLPDGSILNKGYHNVNGGVLITKGGNIPNIDYIRATSALGALLNDYSFTTPADRSRAISQTITPLLKMGEFFTGACPADISEANESQAGKTYRLNIIPAIYNSKATIITSNKGGVGSFDESIGSALANGCPFILIDNFRGKLNSSFLEAVLTTPEKVYIRIPHRRGFSIDARHVTFQLSSNGAVMTHDMANRSLITRVVKQPEKQWSSYPEGDLINHVKKNQPYYLGCVISIVKKWINRGLQKTDTKEHDFQQWAQSMEYIITEIMGLPSQLDGHKDIQSHVGSEDIAWLRAVAIQVENENKLGLALLATELIELAHLANDDIPDILGNNLAQEAIVAGRIMARLFHNDNDNLNLKIDRFNIKRILKKDGFCKTTKYYYFSLLC